MEQAVSQYAPQSDEALAEQASRGDRDAFASLYERHSRGVYDLAVRVVRDPDLAADVVQDTFVKAWQSLPKRRGAQHVKAWLYTIARNGAIDEYRSAGHLVHSLPDDSPSSLPVPYSAIDTDRASNPEDAAEDQELAELVWSSAAALNPKEYSLLDLHLRKGLSVDELAATLGMRKGAVYTMLSRLRDSLEESVTSTLLMRRGRRDCPELDSLLSEIHGGQPAPELLRQAVKRHLDRCPRCQENKRRYASPLELFSALVLVPITSGTQGAIWDRISGRVASADSGSAAQLSNGQLHPWAKATPGTKAALLAIAAAVTTIVAVTVVITLMATRTGDGEAVRDPEDVRSTSHQIGQPSIDDIVIIVWSHQANAASYAPYWSQQPLDLPDAVAGLPGEATETTSPALPEGDWYFHMRTQGNNGVWTSTVHIGPFLIRPPSPSGAPSPANLSPSPPQPVATDTPPATPTPPATRTGTPTPTESGDDGPTQSPVATRAPEVTHAPSVRRTPDAPPSTAEPQLVPDPGALLATVTPTTLHIPLPGHTVTPVPPVPAPTLTSTRRPSATSTQTVKATDTPAGQTTLKQSPTPTSTKPRLPTP